MVGEVHRERARRRERAVPEVPDGHRHGRGLSGRELRHRVERVCGFEVDAHAGVGVVVRDALVRERELVLFVEVK